MNIEINLMPWRADKRKKEKQRSLILFLIIFFLVLIIFYMANYFVFLLTNDQVIVNNKINDEIRILNKNIEKIKLIKFKKNKLMKYILLLKNIENKKILIMHFFSEFALLIPEGIYLDRIKGFKKQITLEGFSQSNEAISQLIRNIEMNPWMKKPSLIEIKQDATANSKSSFKVNLILCEKK